MTVEEAANMFGVSSMSPSYGQSITDIIRILYDSDDEKYYTVLKRLNHRNDWFNLNPEKKLLYLKKEVVKEVIE